MYLGIVVQNNDPDKRGRVKIYVPHISVNVYESWYKNNKDKSFKFPGGNVDSDLSKIIEPLKLILPWSSPALPLVGATGSGRYNSHLDHAAISDSANLKTAQENQDVVDIDSKYNLNTSGVGESPGRKYETENMRLGDAFTTTLSGGKNAPNMINPNSYDYKPSTYSNTAKGSYSIPNVGSHLWLFFENGDPLEPVYFAASSGNEDWNSIYKYNNENDYPSTYENCSKEDDPYYDLDTETYRNKFVINQKGGSLEFINTDNREMLKMTHYSGSFKEFNNSVNTELATKNDQKLVIENQFLTVQGFRSSFVGRDLDSIVRGDIYKKVGNLDRSTHQQWKTVSQLLHDVKKLFDIRRVDLVPEPGTKGYAPCPCCSDGEVMDKIHVISSEMKRFNHSKQPGGSGGGIDNFPVRIVSKNEITESLKASYLNPPMVTRMVYENNWVQNDDPNNSIFGLPCPVCNGTGLSPSTMRGTWDTTAEKTEEKFNELYLQTVDQLFEIEKNLGHGGSEFIDIAKHKSETIGLVMNDFDSVRMDPIGKIYRDSVIVHPLGTFNSQAASPLIEYVHVDDLPGGSYTLNVCNKWNVTVGSGGVSLRTTGPVDISGSIVNVAGDQVNVASANEVNIDGGKRLSLEADIVSIKQRHRKQVLVDSNLGVSQNVVIGGGAHVEGELTVNHVTAPAEIQETDPVVIFGQLLAGLTFQCDLHNGTHRDAACSSDNHPHWSNATLTILPGGSGVGSTSEGSNHDKVRMYPHTHHFKNLPLNLKENNDEVRKDGMDCNAPVRRDAKPVESKSWDEKVYNKNVTNMKSVAHDDIKQPDTYIDKSCEDDNWCTPE